MATAIHPKGVSDGITLSMDSSSPSLSGRRSALSAGVFLTATVTLSPSPPALLAARAEAGDYARPPPEVAPFRPPSGIENAAEPSRRITHVVFLDVATCNISQPRSTSSGVSDVCPADQVTTELGRVLVGLYGDAAPDTVRNFVNAVQSGALLGTDFSGIYVGEPFDGYVSAGRQGRRKDGDVEGWEPQEPRNRDISDPRCFVLKHDRSGVLSLALQASDDPPTVRRQNNYVPLQFMLTTQAAPGLDGQNVVFGRIVEASEVDDIKESFLKKAAARVVQNKSGDTSDTASMPMSTTGDLTTEMMEGSLDPTFLEGRKSAAVLETIAAQPTFRPLKATQRMYALARWLDVRAVASKQSWSRPIGRIVIRGTGIILAQRTVVEEDHLVEASALLGGG